MSLNSSVWATVATTGARSHSTRVAVAMCVALLAAKLLLISRININWDEFYFLSHVHAMVRGELSQSFQMAHTYLFMWLPLLGNDEIQQILVARLVMFVLLVLTAFFTWKLAARWVSPQMAAFAPLCYLATAPVLRHGASFRSDSMLVPLTLGALLLLTARPVRSYADYLGGLCLGIAIALNVKAILMAPLFLTAALLPPRHDHCSTRDRLVRALVQLTRFGLAAAAAAALLILISWLLMPAESAETVGEFAAHVANKTLLSTPLLPQSASFKATLHADWAVWLLIAGGLLVGLVRRNFLAAACGLSLLPILFYRNSFPYYYSVMLAPACVLTVVLLDAVAQNVGNRFGAVAADCTVFGLIGVVTLWGTLNLSGLVSDEQASQRSVVAAVHEIFPTPVPYVDHSGMMASFPKVNFFMSTWGLENYRAGGKGFMRDALRRRTPLLLANRAVLRPDGPAFKQLLAEDRQLIQDSYVQYWGPIYVAGVEASIGPESSIVRVPFPGSYRLEADCPVVIDGISRMDGNVIAITDENQTLTLRAGSCPSRLFDVRLIWATAGHRPLRQPPRGPLYARLIEN